MSKGQRWVMGTRGGVEDTEGRTVAFSLVVPQAAWPEPETVGALPTEELQGSSRDRGSICSWSWKVFQAAGPC